MKKLLFHIFLGFFLPTTICFGQTVDPKEQLFSIKELKSDLAHLKNKLEALHPGLYLYSQKPQIDHVFDSLQNDITAPMTETEFYRHITCISSIIKDGHSIILPAERTMEYHTKNSLFLPYHFTIINKCLYVDLVCTNDNSIAAGTEIISINNVNTTGIINQLMERQVRDGNNLSYPTWILNNYFREYYSFSFGHPENYTIAYKTNGDVHTSTINALPKDSIYFYRQLHYPGKLFSRQPNEGIKLQVEKDRNYALLTIRDFHNDILRKEYKQNFDKVIAAFFEQINDAKTGNLILDLRNNQGGDIENGVFLLSYLLDKPFTVVQDYFCVEGHQLQHCNGPSLGTHKPKPGNFKGNLYVLINGGSFSNSGIVSSCLQANRKTVFIGEETGGNPNVIAGDAKDITLPNTKIQVQVPTRQYVITDKAKNSGQGIMPTHIVMPTLADILEGRDTELNFTIGLFNK